VIKLRLVEEYRGRRIVSNGKLYGIQGELITDCRYMTMEGARNAIDSEAVSRSGGGTQLSHGAGSRVLRMAMTSSAVWGLSLGSSANRSIIRS
jgi:hypothetical protein